MGKTAWTVVGVIEVVLFVVMAIWCGVSGGCSTQLETTAGGTCYMKCFWAFKAATFLSVIGILASIMTLTSKTKEGRRNAAALSVLASGIAAFTTSSFGIGLCSNSEMHCHTTELLFLVLVVITVIIGVVQVAKSDPKGAEKPKMQL